MITNSDHVVLLDFNAAKFGPGAWINQKDKDTVLLGTQGYAAPEQYGFMESSPQTDIYPIGVIINEAVSALAVKNPGFYRIIRKCTDMNPYRRYSSVRLLKLDLMKLGYVDFYTRKQFSDTSWLPPGFRTMTPWKMILTLPVYAFIICVICIVNKFICERSPHNTIWGYIYDNVWVITLLFGPIFIACDYRGICRILPLCRSHNMLVRIIGVLLLIVIYIIINTILFKPLHILLMHYNIF